MKKERFIDLEEDQLDLVKKILRQHIPNKTVWAYGSRVTWKANEISDLDLAVFECDSTQIFNLKEEFEESDLLISVDVMDWESISEKFKQNIKKKYVVLQGKTKLEGWREVKLGDIVQLSKKPWRTNDEELPYIGLEHIDENKLRLNSVGSSNSVASNKYRFSAGNILFGKLRPYFRKVVKPDFDGICSTDIWVVIPKEDKNKDFIFYFFASQELVDIAYSSSSGTRMPRADWTFLSETVWALPPLPEQKAIAEVLSSLDDKIDLLHRQNKTLENLAQTLFRQWFVEDAGDWDEKSLLDVIGLVGGGTPTTSIPEYWDGDIPWLSGGDIASAHKSFINSSCKTITKEGLTNSSTKLLPKLATIITARGTVGKYGLLSRPMVCSQSNYGIMPKIGDCYYFTYLLISHVVSDLQSSAYGSVFDTITTATFKYLIVSVPPESEVIDFEKSVAEYFTKKLANQNQITILENLRDTLLPKLMSGTVIIKNI